MNQFCSADRYGPHGVYLTKANVSLYSEQRFSKTDIHSI